MTILETNRTRIRRIVESDFDEMMVVYGDLELMKYVGDSTALSEEDGRKWIEITLANYEKRGYGLFLVEDLEGRCIGFAGISHPGGQEEAEIKYTFKKSVWGKGIATEVVGGLTNHALKVWNLPLIIATIDPANTASQAVIAKCGYTRQEDRIEDDGEVTAVWKINQA